MFRKLVLSMAALSVAASVAWADVAAEAIPPDFLSQFAPLALGLLTAQFPNPTVKVDADPSKAVGYHVDQKVAVVCLPDKAITADAVAKAGEKDVPVAILATKSLTVEHDGKAVTGEKLAVADFNGEIKIPVFFLSVRAMGEDRVLSVYSKDGKPVTTSVLKKQSGDANEVVGAQLKGVDLEKKKAEVTVSIGGAYQAMLKLAFLE